MSATPLPHLLSALRDPALALHWPLAQWQETVRTARRLRLLARLAAGIESAGLMSDVNALPRAHLVAELQLSRWRMQSLLWAMQGIGQTLQASPFPRVLLKGAAYLGQALPISAGRMPADLDMLVPRTHLEDAQQRLQGAGWAELELDAHDRRYYLEWSHEVPPMHHPVHRMELDLHHNILPPLARTTVDAQLLLARLRPSRYDGWSVLHPVDQVLHSASHLFLDAEPRERLRDIVDLDGLMRYFETYESGFWDELPRRARELGLSEALALAVHFAMAWLSTPVPASALAEINAAGPGPVRRAWLLPMWSALLTPGDADAAPPWRQQLAAQLVLMRYHAQRLPWRLLLPHLWHKFRARHAAAQAVDQVAAKP